MLLLPAQLQRQDPQRGTAARPRQSPYQPTGWTRPSRGMTMVLARTARGAGAGRFGGGAAWTASAAWAAAAAAALAACARASAAAWAAAWAAATRSRSSWRTRRWSAASALAMATPPAYTGWIAATGCHVKRGKLRSQIATPPTRGARQRRTRLAMGRATRARRQGLRGLHDRHVSAPRCGKASVIVEFASLRGYLRFLTRSARPGLPRRSSPLAGLGRCSARPH